LTACAGHASDAAALAAAAHQSAMQETFRLLDDACLRGGPTGQLAQRLRASGALGVPGEENPVSLYSQRCPLERCVSPNQNSPAHVLIIKSCRSGSPAALHDPTGTSTAIHWWLLIAMDGETSRLLCRSLPWTSAS